MQRAAGANKRASLRQIPPLASASSLATRCHRGATKSCGCARGTRARFSPLAWGKYPTASTPALCYGQSEGGLSRRIFLSPSITNHSMFRELPASQQGEEAGSGRQFPAVPGTHTFSWCSGRCTPCTIRQRTNRVLSPKPRFRDSPAELQSRRGRLRQREIAGLPSKPPSLPSQTPFLP